MAIEKIVRETVKPLTPEKVLIKSLQGGVERARQACGLSVIVQSRSRELERQRRGEKGTQDVAKRRSSARRWMRVELIDL